MGKAPDPEEIRPAMSRPRPDTVLRTASRLADAELHTVADAVTR
ncbi:hypothetical protein ACIRU2_19670 [Streptomyces sp. NPDC101169]